MITKWDSRFMDVAKLVSTWSKDDKKQVGSVIVNDNRHIVSTGFNGQPRGLDDDASHRGEKPYKGYYYEHSERNAIYSAAFRGVSLAGCTLYTTFFPCADCTRAVIQAGIKKVVTPEPDMEYVAYADSWRFSQSMLAEAGIEVVYMEEA